MDFSNLVCSLIAVTTPHKAMVDANGVKVYTKPVKTYVYYCAPKEQVVQKTRSTGMRYYANK